MDLTEFTPEQLEMLRKNSKDELKDIDNRAATLEEQRQELLKFINQIDTFLYKTPVRQVTSKVVASSEHIRPFNAEILSELQTIKEHDESAAESERHSFDNSLNKFLLSEPAKKVSSRQKSSERFSGYNDVFDEVPSNSPKFKSQSMDYFDQKPVNNLSDTELKIKMRAYGLKTGTKAEMERDARQCEEFMKSSYLLTRKITVLIQIYARYVRRRWRSETGESAPGSDKTR